MQFLDSKPCRNRSRFASVALWGVWLKPTSGTEVVEAKVGAHRGLQHLMRFVFYVFFGSSFGDLWVNAIIWYTTQYLRTCFLN